MKTEMGIMCLALLTPWSVAMAAQRPFLMGTSIFHDYFQLDPENLPDKDMLSVHIDNYLGIPWTAFQNGTPLPALWVSRWTTIQSEVTASGKVLYLSLGFFSGNRKTLADAIDANGNDTANWAPTDANGCYPFATDPNAQVYKQAYINYAKWAINEIHPTYLSPSVEISIYLEHCPAETTALIQWYSDVHQALKEAYPNLVIFPTFQAENMYGISDPGAWCGGTMTDASLAACFQQRLDQAVSIPADRIAFSFYPTGWLYPPTAPNNYTAAPPYEDMFTRVKNTTTRRIWISETGWGAVQILSSYQHASPPSSCGPVLVPSPLLNSEANMANHMTQLLAQAQAKQFEGVVWWENRDFLDATTASVCPCPDSSFTCTSCEQLYDLGVSSATGDTLEFEWRSLGNMGLRYNDGTTRNAIYSIWTSYLNQPFTTNPSGNESLDAIQIYPNPMRPSLGHTGINFTQLPPGARLRIYTLSGEKVKDLSADTVGHTTWDGTNLAGKNAASGVYLVYVQGTGGSTTLKVAIQR